MRSGARSSCCGSWHEPGRVPPGTARIRSILKQEDLFVVVSDPFLSETAELADVVLPTAIWGEKTGTFTNADRTVHLSEQAIDPPGEARRDMDIFLDYAERLGLEDKDGERLIQVEDGRRGIPRRGKSARRADRATTRKSRTRACAAEAASSGAPRARALRQITSSRPAQTLTPQEFGHELLTGMQFDPAAHAALNPAGRAILKAADYKPPREQPSEEYPLRLTTGRTVYHFHTRTKTGRTPELQEAAPDVWVELSAADGERLGLAEGDRVRVESARGSSKLPPD